MPLLRQFLMASLLLAQPVICTAQTTISWQNDLDAARNLAEQNQKLLLVHFYNDHCGPCKMLDATVFNQPTVAGAVHSHFVPVKLNTNDFPATAERFGIRRVPTDVVITPQGQVIERMISPATPMAYISQMSGVAEQYRQQMARNFNKAVPQSSTSEPLNRAYANLPVPGDTNSFTNSPADSAGMTTANPHVQAKVDGANHPTGNQAMGAPEAQPVAVANPYAQTVPPIVQPQPPTNQVVAAPEVPPITPGESAESAAPSATTATGTNQSANSNAVVAAAQLPPDSPPMGFFGYCPVTMKKENRWQRGDVRWGCYHRGRTYLFASQEARDEFLQPGQADQFAPALSGSDPVLAMDTGKSEPGKREFGLEYQGQFYLFSNEENLRKFCSQAERYASGVRQAMNGESTGRTLR